MPAGGAAGEGAGGAAGGAADMPAGGAAASGAAFGSSPAQIEAVWIYCKTMLNGYAR